MLLFRTANYSTRNIPVLSQETVSAIGHILLHYKATIVIACPQSITSDIVSKVSSPGHKLQANHPQTQQVCAWTRHIHVD